MFNEFLAEIAKIFEKENADTLSYDELAFISAKKWKKLIKKRFGKRLV
jgi:hypothetical protein